MSTVIAPAPTASPNNCGQCIPVVGRPGDVLFYVPPVALDIINGDRVAACEEAIRLYNPNSTFPCNYMQIGANRMSARTQTGPLCVLFVPISADVYTPCVVDRFIAQYRRYSPMRAPTAFSRVVSHEPESPLTVALTVQEIRNTARSAGAHIAAWQNNDQLALGRRGRVIYYNIFCGMSGVFPGTHTPPHPWSKRNPKYNTYAVIDWESVPAENIIRM